MRIIRKTKTIIKRVVLPKHPKIFCVGRNKTGTTTIHDAMVESRILVGPQREAERLAPYYHLGNFDPIIGYCRKYRAFQDVPFSWSGTYRYLDAAFPDAKFILSVRDSADQWYDSAYRFRVKRFGRYPTKEDLQNSEYVWKGWEWENHVARYGAEVPVMIDPDKAKQEYLKHNESVIQHFKDRPSKLLVINVAKPGAYQHFCTFLGLKPVREEFPWSNKT